MRQISRRGLLAAAAGVSLSVASARAQVVIPPSKIAPPSAADRALLKGAIDIHSHLDPDSFGPASSQAARALDVIDMAKRAKAAGMRGFVVKQHYDQSAQLAYIARKEVPGVEVFGQLCMNLTVGGLNVDAVRHFTEVKGGYARIVSMPTWDSENNVLKSRDPTRPFISVARNGELLPETKAVIAAVAAAKMRDTNATLALSTGHLAPAEALMVIREARRQGVARIVVTHAMGPPVSMDLAQMKEAVSLGAYIEFVAGMALGEHAEFSAQEYYDAIRALGLDHAILSSDTGQQNRPFPDDAIAIVAGQLLKKGLTKAELQTVMSVNPAKLLGITT